MRVHTKLLVCGLPHFRDHPKLLHQAQSVEVGPVFHYFALGEPLDGDACHLHPVACGWTKVFGLALVGAASTEAGDHLIPFGYLVLYGVLKVGEGLLEVGGELLGALHTVYVPEGRLMADLVGGVDLLGGVEVAPWLNISWDSQCTTVLFSSDIKRFLPSYPALAKAGHPFPP
jgi:hypothetical protein